MRSPHQNKLPNYLFHVPNSETLLNLTQLERMVERPVKRPDYVDIVDARTHKRLGRMEPRLALLKFL